jgi:hypothetical protein
MEVVKRRWTKAQKRHTKTRFASSNFTREKPGCHTPGFSDARYSVQTHRRGTQTRFNSLTGDEARHIGAKPESARPCRLQSWWLSHLPRLEEKATAGGPPSFYSQPNNKGGCPILAIFPIARVGSNKAKCPSPGIFGPGIFLSKVLYHLPAKHQPSSPATASATVSTALTPTAHQPAPRAG